MYLDLIASEGFLSVNKVMIKALGAQAAIYLSALANEVGRSVRSGEMIDGFAIVDKEALQESLGITEERQHELDVTLTELNFMEVHENHTNAVGVNFQAVISLISGCDEKTIAKLSKQTATVLKSTAKKTNAAKKTVALAEKDAKQRGILGGMKRHLAELEQDEELQQAYFAWIDSVYANKRYLTHAAIDIFVQGLRAYNTNKATQLDILKHAVTTGYNEISWVINRWESVSKQSYKPKVEQNQKVSTGVRSDISF